MIKRMGSHQAGRRSRSDILLILSKPLHLPVNDCEAVSFFTASKLDLVNWCGNVEYAVYPKLEVFINALFAKLWERLSNSVVY